MLKLGIEPKTFALLARRSNQLSYSSTEHAGLLGSLNLLVWEKWSEDTPFELNIPVRKGREKDSDNKQRNHHSLEALWRIPHT